MKPPNRTSREALPRFLPACAGQKPGRASLRRLLGATLSAAVFCAAAPAQQSIVPGASRAGLSRDDQLSLLKTREAELELEKANAEVERTELELKDTKALFDENIETINKLRKAEQAFKEAQIEYQQAQIRLEQTRLEFLKNATLIRVVNAKIYRGEAGEVMASIELKNDSNINKARVVMAQKAEVSEENLASLLKVDKIIVTLWGTAYLNTGEEEKLRQAKAIIGDPFQQIVPALKLGDTEELKFRLLKRDVEHVTVQIDYLETSKEYDVFLKKEALQDLPTITSAQFDQHGDLGSAIRYNLQLERLAKTEQSFGLRVLNFPEEVRFAFIDPTTSAKMTTLKFTNEESVRTVDFEVSLPEKLNPELIDTNIPFYIVVARPKDLDQVHALKKRYGKKPIPAEDVAKLKGNKVELILIPKGVGKLDIIVANLFKEIQQEQDVVLKFSIMNSGTLALHRVTPTMDLPLEWEGVLTPREVGTIEPGQKTLITADIKPPLDVAVGEYTIKVEAEGYSGVETIESKEKDFTVRVAAQSSLTGTLVLVAVLVVLVLGIAVASVKISRR